jgi:hypothetical protein
MELAEYSMALGEQGFRVVPGQKETLWVEYERYTLLRAPAFCLAPPEPDELRKVFRQSGAALISYALEPDGSHQANASVYVCTDQGYALEKLKPEMRHNVSVGLRKLRIAPLAPSELLSHGMQAFCDTRRRFGLGDGTPEEFRRRFGSWMTCPAHVVLGAWKDNTLAAFQCITQVDDWAELCGAYSMTALRNFKPNDALSYVALSQSLRERHCRIVSAGLSSIQSRQDEGLHIFKTKVGLEPRPVHRAFVLNPFLAPFAGRVVLKAMKAVLTFKPGSRRLRKAAGILSSILDEEKLRHDYVKP